MVGISATCDWMCRANSRSTLARSWGIGSNISARVAAEGFCAVGFKLVRSEHRSARSVNASTHANPCDLLKLRVEDPVEVLRRRRADCRAVRTTEFGDGLGHAGDMRRFVAF